MDKDNVRKLTEVATKDGDGPIERIREAADSAWETGRKAWRDMSAQGKDAMAGAQQSSKEAWEDAQKLVQKHPGKAVGIALLVGTAIGALLAFRKQNSQER